MIFIVIGNLCRLPIFVEYLISIGFAKIPAILLSLFTKIIFWCFLSLHKIHQTQTMYIYSDILIPINSKYFEWLDLYTNKSNEKI